VYDFNRIRVEDSVAYLRYIADKEGVRYDEESLNLIAQKADGGMRDALSMFDKAVSFCNADLQYKAVAQTLNVLDYDTYFTMTEQLLDGDYTQALIRFDEVLAKGFSGQTFMAGLNQHMRDLLLAKGPAITLIELTGTLLERYRRQAESCSTEFLFGAISILTDADGRIKQSSNQRLLVELGLMKIASLGKKKNDDTPLEEYYPLPDLPSTITTAGGSAVVPQSAQPAPAPQSAEQPAPVAPQVAAPAEQNTSSSEPAPRPTAGVRRSSLAGMSITSMMNSLSQSATQPAESQSVKEPVIQDIDEGCEQKIADKRQAVLDAILNERPRFVVAFERMKVCGNIIEVEVPSQTLYEEIMRSKTEILLLIARTAGVNGMMDLKINVNEVVRAARPIKLEDRIRHMNEKNPMLLELKKVLDMEYE
jgi:DNA polymerase-3 subunit gamma/tau